MASFKTQKVVGDLGSQEVAQLVVSYNALLDVFGDLITALKTAADTAAINALAVAAEPVLEANVTKQQALPGIPLNPARTAV